LKALILVSMAWKPTQILLLRNKLSGFYFQLKVKSPL
jgi:hypothetical protein